MCNVTCSVTCSVTCNVTCSVTCSVTCNVTCNITCNVTCSVTCVARISITPHSPQHNRREEEHSSRTRLLATRDKIPAPQSDLLCDRDTVLSASY